MGIIYALVEHGWYDDFGYSFIKLDERDKEKFTEYCEQSTLIPGGEKPSLALKYWVKDIESINKERNDIITIQELQEDAKEEVKRIDKMKETHYLFKDRDKVARLLEYDFIEV